MWVYKIKRDSASHMQRYKAWLVTKGYLQALGIDYGETYSPIIKPTSIQVVLTLALIHNWPIRQLDGSNAFLHGTLKEEVYITQPQGYVNPQFSTHVCRLRKALYGLKQAPRAWYEELRTFLLRCHFTQSKVDLSLFVFRSSKGTIFLLVYGDDIILTGSSLSLLTSFISKLQATFSIKDLGPLHYFLDIQATFTDHGFLLSQTKYIQDLLLRLNL